MLNRFDKKEIQIYAAICLLKYCEYAGISHKSINELVVHLLSIATTENLPQWERKGAKCSLSGRGDDIPDELDDLIPDIYKIEFIELLEAVVEVGIVDMYGADTNKPLEFIKKCISVLNKHDIELPFNFLSTALRSL